MPKVEIARSTTRLPTGSGLGQLTFGANTGKALQQIGSTVSAFADVKVEEFKLARDNNYTITEQVKMTSDLNDLQTSLKDEYASNPEGYADAYFKQAQDMLSRADDTAPSTRASTALKNRMSQVVINGVNSAKAYEREASVVAMVRKTDESRNIFLNNVSPLPADLDANLASVKELNSSLTSAVSPKDLARINNVDEYNVVKSMVSKSLEIAGGQSGVDRQRSLDSAEELLESDKVSKILDPDEISQLEDYVQQARKAAIDDDKILHTQAVTDLTTNVNANLIAENAVEASNSIQEALDTGLITNGDADHVRLFKLVAEGSKDQRSADEVRAIMANNSRLAPTAKNQKGLDVVLKDKLGKGVNLFSKDIPEGAPRDNYIGVVALAGILPTPDREGLVNALNSRDPTSVTSAAKTASVLKEAGVNLGLGPDQSAQLLYVNTQLAAGSTPDQIASTMEADRRMFSSDAKLGERLDMAVAKEFNTKPEKLKENVRELLSSGGLKGVYDPRIATAIVAQAKSIHRLDRNTTPEDALKKAARLVIESGDYTAVKIGGRNVAVEGFDTDGLSTREATAQLGAKTESSIRRYLRGQGVIGDELDDRVKDSMKGVSFTPHEGGQAISYTSEDRGTTILSSEVTNPNGSTSTVPVTVKVSAKDTFSEKVKALTSGIEKFDTTLDRYNESLGEGDNTEEEMAVSSILESTSKLLHAQRRMVADLEDGEASKKFGGSYRADTGRIKKRVHTIEAEIKKNMKSIETIMGKEKAEELLNPTQGEGALQGGASEDELGGGDNGDNLDSIGGDTLQGGDPDETGIDWAFIGEQEGDRLTAYTLDPSKSDSGVTIATGFDLGTRNEQDLKNMGLPESLIKKFKPYLGLKKQKAVDALKKAPMKIDAKEAAIVNKLVKKDETRKMTKVYGKERLAKMTKRQRTIVASVFFQYNKGSPIFIRLVKAAVDSGKASDWDKVEEELRNFKGKHPSRRIREANYLIKK